MTIAATDMTPEQRLTRDVKYVLAQHGRFLALCGGQTDTRRLLVVISATHGAEQHLPRSLPRLFSQVRASGRAVDLLLGCNNAFESPALVDFLARQSGWRLTRGYCAKVEPDRPAPVIDRTGIPLLIGTAPVDQDRVFLVYQRSAGEGSPNAAAGKIRMLGDLYGLVEDSLRSGWVPPRWLLECDAESEFDQMAPWTSSGHQTPGLKLLLSRATEGPEPELVGTRNRFVAYQTDGAGIRLPRPESPLPAIQLYLNLVHAQARGFNWLPGSGTLGRTEVMAALATTISRHYPSVSIEDVMRSVLARAAGFSVRIEPRVASLNRCPPGRDGRGARRQMARWIAGKKELERLYGKPAMAGITPCSLIEVFMGGVRMAVRQLLALTSPAGLCPVAVNCMRILSGLPLYVHLLVTSSSGRSDDPDHPAAW